jgi:FkbM family methyltransferase
LDFGAEFDCSGWVQMNSLYVLIYRMYAACKRSPAGRLLQRHKWMLGASIRGKLWITQHLFPSRRVWMQVEAGLARGMWMRVRIPGEAGLCSGRHEPHVQEALATLLRPGDVAYDVGAHLGSIALGMAQLVGPTGRVVAFEADPGNWARLKEMCARNNLERSLQVVRAAVWSRTADDGIAFRQGRPRTGTAHGGVESDGQRPVLADGALVRVPALTLDDFVAAGGPPPQLIKIDVEGGDYEVLRGGPKLFATLKPLLVVEVHHPRVAEQIRAWLVEFHYSAEWHIPKEGFPRWMIACASEKAVARGT